MALTAGLLLTIMAFGIDFGLWTLHQNRLQRAADVAAIAGAEARGRGGSATDISNAVNNTLTLNGFGTTNFTIQTGTPSATEVSVDLTNTAPPMFFSKLIMSNMKIHRQSIATTGRCLGSCDRKLLISPPAALNLKSTGDGWRPIMIDDRAYTVNHHSNGNYIVCYKLDGSICPGYPTCTGGQTSMVSDSELWEKDQSIWYTVDRFSGSGQSITLECWDTKSTKSCGSTVMATHADQSGGTSQWVTSMQARVGSKLYYFNNRTDEVLCYDMDRTATTTPARPCAGYPKMDTVANGLDHTIAAATNPDWPINHVVGTKIYREFTAPTQVYVLCWDTATGAPCGGFTPYVYATEPFNTGYKTWGSWWFFPVPNAAGTKIGFCSYVRSEATNCFNLSGNALAVPAGLEAAMPPTPNRFAGLPYLDGTYGLFPAYSADTLYCFNYATGASCGQKSGMGNPYVVTKLDADNCALVLGHNAKLFALDPRNLDPCQPSTSSKKIWPCDCKNGTQCWGVLEFSPDDLKNFVSFSVTVRNPSGTTVLGPLNLLTNGGRVDMSALPINVEYLSLDFSPVAKSGVTWNQGMTANLNVTPRAVLR